MMLAYPSTSIGLRRNTGRPLASDESTTFHKVVWRHAGSSMAGLSVYRKFTAQSAVKEFRKSVGIWRS